MHSLDATLCYSSFIWCSLCSSCPWPWKDSNLHLYLGLSCFFLYCCLKSLYFFLPLYGFKTPTTIAWYLLDLMVPIYTSLSFSWVNDSMKSTSDGMCQFRAVSLLEWNVLTSTEYYGPSFESMDNMRFPYFFSMPHYSSWSTNDLNFVKKSWIVSKWAGLSEISSFSSWWPLVSSDLLNNASRLSHTSLGVVRLSTWNIKSL